MSVMLLTEHHLEFLSLKGGCTGSSESTLVKMPRCWESHVAAQFLLPNENHIYQQSLPKDSDFDELLHLQAILADKIKLNMS